jgi:hypothetical protein
VDGARRGGRADQPAPADPQARRLRLADRLATELCDLPPRVWAVRSQGANQSLRVSIEHEEVLADLMVEVWDLTRVRPLTPDLVVTRSGAGGSVLITHGDTWSLVARSGGPVLVVSDRLSYVVWVEPSWWWEEELDAVVGALFDGVRGLPPITENDLPPVPPPWHRERNW